MEWKDKLRCAKDQQEAATNELNAMKQEQTMWTEQREAEQARLTQEIDSLNVQLNNHKDELEKTQKDSVQANEQIAELSKTIAQLRRKRKPKTTCQGSQTPPAQDQSIEELRATLNQQVEAQTTIARLAMEERDQLKRRNAELKRSIPSQSTDEKMLLAELESIRSIIEGQPSGDAWEHVMSCGALASAVALKQRIIKSPWIRKAKPPPNNAGSSPRLPPTIIRKRVSLSRNGM